MSKSEVKHLSIWVIYDHPTDYPNSFVARRWECANLPHATTDTIAENKLVDLRNEFMRRGLVIIPRHPHDDPKILETWV